MNKILEFHSEDEGKGEISALTLSHRLTQTIRIIYKEKQQNFDSSIAWWRPNPTPPPFSFYKKTLNRDREVYKKKFLAVWLAYVFGIWRNFVQ